MNRRDALKLSLLAGATLATRPAWALPTVGEGDGTPAQFIPKGLPDPKAHQDDLAKYPKCPYCGMDRKQFHHSRMLVHYGDDLADGVCSLHCAAISLALNIDRDPKAIWVGDNADAAAVKALSDADKASFLVGGSSRGVMSRRSKVAYSSATAAQAARATQGGEIVTFEQALQAAYADMAQDVAMIRKNRAERRKRAMAGKS